MREEEIQKIKKSCPSSWEGRKNIEAGGNDHQEETPLRGDPARRKRKVLLICLSKAAVSVVLIVFLASTIDLANLTQRLTAVSYGTLFLAGCLEIVAVAIAAWRWRIVLSALNLPTRYAVVFRLFYVGQFIDQVFPTNIGGDVFRTWGVFRAGSKILRALMAVAVDRIVALIGLALLVIPGLYFLADNAEDKTPIWIMLVFVLGVGAGVILFLALGVLVVPGWLLAHSGLNRLMVWVREASIFARPVLTKWKTVLPVITLAVAVHGLAVISILVLAQGLDIPINAGAAFALVPPAILASVIPISYAGWGARESVMVVFLGYTGVAPEAAIGLSLLFGGLNFLVSLPAAMLWLGTSDLRSSNN